MVESEIDEYKLDTNQGKKDQTLRVSIVTDRICMLISNPKDLRERYINLITLEQLRDVCEIFNTTKTINEAAAVLKHAIENNLILYSEDEESGNVEIKFNISQGEKKYPPFVIPLPFDSDDDDKQNESKPQTTEEEEIQYATTNENEVEVLPTKYDYQGNKEAEAKYGKSDKSTVDYAEPIIQSKVKEANVFLEYIEPILQVHYPDGTTKSTPLPPRIQTADGKKPNISPEQLKSIREQMAKSFNQTIAEFENEKNRASSVANKKRKNNSNYSQQSMNNFMNNMTIQKPDNRSKINNKRNLNQEKVNNTVRSALKPEGNNMNNTINVSSIRQAKTSFNTYDNSNSLTQRGTTSTEVFPRDNYMKYKNQYNTKGISDYSSSSVPTKPLVIPNYNYNGLPNPSIRNNLTTLNNSHSISNYMQYTQDPQSLIQEIPKMLDQSQYMNYNMNQTMYQRGLNKSSSSPNIATLDKYNYNFYQQNHNQIPQYNLGFSQNQSYFQNHFNNVDLGYSFNNSTPIKNMQNHGAIQYNNNNSQIVFNNSRLLNPNLNQTTNQYQNSGHSLNDISQSFNLSMSHRKIGSNVGLSRYNSSQNPLISQTYTTQIRQQQLDLQKIQEQQRIQEQKRIQEQQNAQKQRLLEISQQRKQMRNMYTEYPQQQIGKNNMGFQNSNQGFAEVSTLNKRSKPATNEIKSNLKPKQTQPMDKRRINQPSQVQAQFMNQPLKQSQSQQIMRTTPPIKAPEITKQQIALAQMASLQNSQNPNSISASQAIPLQNRFLDSSGNEETQSQYEREELKYQETEEEEKPKITQQIQSPLRGEDEEDPEAEKLFETETGLIIFRNGLLYGILHKYAEIDEVVSKIQLKLKAGVKFMLLYRASVDGDKASVFHKKCDGHPMTLVLVETTKGARFGGFTTKTWDGHCVKKIDNDAFVFSLNKRRIYDVEKNEFAIGGYPKFGPVFFGCQIRIYDKCFVKGGSTCHRGLNYKTKEEFELNKGEQKYIVKEIEVYNIEIIQV